ncbi:MAG TPA: MFS transporter [Fibrobacteria bacterium]|nr:MFS transporter [Fibrobacteria bacterium]
MESHPSFQESLRPEEAPRQDANDHASSFLRLSILAVAGVCAFLNLYAAQPLLPTLAQVFQASPERISLTVSATTFAVALSAPFFGMLSDRYGRRKIMVVSLFGLAIPTLMAATSQSLRELVLWRFLTGIFMPGIIASAMAYIAEEWKRGAAQAMAIYVTSTVLGGFLGRMGAGFFCEHGTWQVSFAVLGATTFAGAVAVWRWLPASSSVVATGNVTAWWSEVGHHLGNPRLLATFAVGFGVLFSLVATFTYLTFHLAASPYFLGPTQQGMIFCVYLLGLVATPASGNWIQRFGAANAVLGAVAISCIGVLLTLATPLPVVVAGLALCTSGVFVCQAAASNFVGQVADRSRSVAAGLYVSCYYTGGSAGAVVSGLAWNRGGWAACVALVVAVQFACAAVVALLWRAPESLVTEEVQPA